MKIRGVLCVLLWCLVAESAMAGLQSDYMRGAFSGDLAFMTTLSDNDRASPLYQRFQARFVERQTPENWANINDDFVYRAALHYRDYWVAALLNPAEHDQAEQALRQAIQTLIIDSGEPAGDGDPLDQLQTLIRARGWGFQGGRTPPLQDFMLWRNDELMAFEVELHDTMQSVQVHMMDDFISQGWANFATFGHSGTGGWADRQALYCMRDSYDLQSERFLVSYLKHEGRHFADFIRFPELKSADLEYRAKLTELIFSQQTLHALLHQFSDHANMQSTAPHALANAYLLDRMQQALVDKGSLDESDIAANWWQYVPADAIEQVARQLLDEHEAALENDGAMTTHGVLEPEG